MIFKETKLKGSFIIEVNPFMDERGWLSRTYCKNEFEKINHHTEWVQLNHSFTQHKGTVRGMHYQLPPFGEIKMVKCIAGAVFDVIVDLRKKSCTFLQWFGAELSGQNKKMMYIPQGFAHGFQSLTENCELLYHHTEFYQPSVEAGIKYNDPKVNIKWPLMVTNISERDTAHTYIDANFKGI
jgi:dTDP-4-dehydrorhamnose 3,5-epimerase